MAAMRKLEFPEESYIREAFRVGRATRQRLSMKALGEPDTSLQARVLHIDPEHSHRLSQVLVEKGDGGDLAPVVVFREAAGKKETLWLADGFHRHDVYRKLGRPDIPAVVIEGTRSDAVAYATMCNRIVSLARKPEDVKKAVYMLLEDPTWFARGKHALASHVGCSHSTVERVRCQFCAETGRELPATFINGSGVSIDRKTGRAMGDPTLIEIQRPGSSYFKARVHGTNHYLGVERAAASEKLDELLRSDLPQESLPSWLARRGFVAVRAPIKCLPGHRVGNFLVVTTRDRTPMELARVVGSLVLQRAAYGENLRAVALCKGLAGPLAQHAARNGIEFMTPDEFLASLKETE